MLMPGEPLAASECIAALSSSIADAILAELSKCSEFSVRMASILLAHDVKSSERPDAWTETMRLAHSRTASCKRAAEKMCSVCGWFKSSICVKGPTNQLTRAAQAGYNMEQDRHRGVEW